GYISQTTESFVGALKRQALDNPLQAVAAVTAVAVPAVRLARGVPLPLLMIGAGLALTSGTVRRSAAEATEPAMTKAGEIAGHAAERMQALRRSVTDAVTATKGQAEAAQQGAAALADDAEDQAVRAAGTV